MRPVQVVAAQPNRSVRPTFDDGIGVLLLGRRPELKQRICPGRLRLDSFASGGYLRLNPGRPPNSLKSSRVLETWWRRPVSNGDSEADSPKCGKSDPCYF